MKTCMTLLLLTILFASALAFTPSSSFSGSRMVVSVPSSSSLSMFFGPKKDDGSPGDYVCKDCGYVFTKGPKAWAALDDKWKCPPCGAPKFRFEKVPKGSASGKVDVKKSWFK